MVQDPAARAPRRQRRMDLGPRLGRAVIATLLLTPTLLILGPMQSADAHAVLLRADPPDGAVLAAPPTQVTLEFSEPVEAIGAALRVFALDGTRVDLGAPAGPAPASTDDRDRLAVALPEGLPDGGYVVAWRVRSVDGHAVAGTLRFTVGDGPPVPDDVVAVLADGGAPPAVRFLDRAVRGIVLLGLLVAAGTLFAASAVARTPEQRRLARSAAGRTATATLLVVPAGLWLQGAVQAGATGAAIVWATLVGTPATAAAIAHVAGLAAIALMATRSSARKEARPRPLRLELQLAAVISGAIALLPLAAEGHQLTAIAGRPAALLPGLDAVHVVAGSLWVGAVLLLLLAVRSRTEDAEATIGLAHRVGRVSLVALVSVTVAGSAQALVLLGGIAQLRAGLATPYGVALATKVALVATAVIAAAAARRRASRSGGWRRASRLLTVELALLGGIIVVTGTLVTLPPPATAVPTVATSSVALDETLVLEVGVDGSRPGRTELHLYIVEDGALTGRALDVRVSLTSVRDDLGPFIVTPLLVEPGHWFAALEPLPTGDWTVEVTVGLDRFEERRVTLVVPLR
jgi:copper transport protein